MEKHPELADQPLEHLLANLETLDIPEADKKAIRNHGGGHSNHSLFWQLMAPTNTVDTELVKEIEQQWPLAEFKKTYSEQALNIFGSGWMWLVRNGDGKLEMYATGQQDSPLMKGHLPIIGLDVWEHAYYLKYQNKRADYIDAWWNVLKLLP